MTNQKLIVALFAVSLFSVVHSWTTPSPLISRISLHKSSVQPISISLFTSTSLNAVKEPETKTDDPSAEETTEAYGLEAGLFQSLKKEDGGQTAKELLAKYGVAYLATSIPLAIVSFTVCYALVDSGVDVSDLLSKVGITAGDTGEKVGTFAIAYAAHKAASPIRFPPTVLLTPIVAKLIGKEPESADAETAEE